MSEELEQILLQLTQPDNAVIQQATAQLKLAFKDPAIIPALCAVMTTSQNHQIRQSAAVMLRMRVKKHWKKISPDHRESLFGELFFPAFFCSHTVRHSLSQLSAVMVKHETPDRWPALLELLNQSTKSNNPQDRQVGLLLLSKVVESNPEPFKPHYHQLLQLFGDVLQQDLENPACLYYCILTLTAITAYVGSEEMNLMRSLIPKMIIALKHLIKADQDQASEAMEIFDELMESEVSIIVPHIVEIVHFCLEVNTTLSDSLRVKALSCIAFLIRLKSKTVLKHKLLSPILQGIFPVLSAAPPPGEEDPEDDENDSGDGSDSESPKHYAAQVRSGPPSMPLAQACLSSGNPYERKGGLMCLAVLAEGCADHIRTNGSTLMLLSSMLQTVCQSLSDSNQVVRSAGLFALGQFSEHLQPEVSKYCSELMPLLLGYMSCLNQAKVGHVTKAFYALENFMENLGEEIAPYLPTLMETMLSALHNAEELKIKELAVSAIGAIANAAKELLVPYFPPVIESLKGFLTATTEEMRALQTQALDTLSVLARTIGKDVFGPLAAECVQLGLNLSNTIDDPDLRRCTYSLYSAVSTVSPDCLTPHLDSITTVMLMGLKSTEGVTAGPPRRTRRSDVLFERVYNDGRLVPRFSVENAFIDEKEDACDALGEIFPHEDVRRAAFGAMGQFCRAQHKVWKETPSEANHQAMHKLLDVVLPCLVETVRSERERHVVMSVLEAMNGVVKACQGEALQQPGRLQDISHAIRDVLKKKTVCQDGGGDEAEDEDQQAEYDAMLQEFAGEGIPVLASAVPADVFLPYLNDLLPLIMSKAKASCTVADRSFSVGTLGEVLQSLVTVSGGRAVAGRLANRLLPVLVAGVRDSNSEVRNNSVFGLGALAEAAGPVIVSDFPMMLSVFSNLLSKEDDRRVIDNLCAALCRMITSNVEVIPLEQVVPALVARLPLEEDLEENKTVYSCLAMLYTHSPGLVRTPCPTCAPAYFQLSQPRLAFQMSEPAPCSVSVQIQHSAEFQAAVTSLPAEQQAVLSAAISVS
uniref:Importin 4 n=1 Tax=Gadus morhua TaxID=8049 RepID=A0A8C5FQN6_GADMO